MELLAILIIVAIILAIIKVGSVLWRIIGVIFTIFLPVSYTHLTLPTKA